MAETERQTKKSTTLVTITLEPSETIEKAKSLHADLTVVFGKEGVKKVRLDATKTNNVDSSFLQLWCAASLHASLQDKQLEFKGITPEVQKQFELAGLAIPA